MKIKSIMLFAVGVMFFMSSVAQAQKALGDLTDPKSVSLAVTLSTQYDHINSPGDAADRKGDGFLDGVCWGNINKGTPLSRAGGQQG